MSGPRPSVRSYREGDEVGILQMFKDVFGGQRTVEEWKWQFTGGPEGSGWVAVLEAGEEIVGQHAMMRKDLVFRGKRMICAHEVDAMVKESHRGIGQYVKLAEQNYAGAQEKGCRVVLGFGSRNSYPGSIPLLMRAMGWGSIDNLKYYSMRVGRRRLFGPFDGIVKRLRRAVWSARLTLDKRTHAPGLTFASSDTVPVGFAEGLRHIRDYETTAVFKDIAYLTWRYENHPEFDYRFHFALADGKVEGLVVTRDCGDVVAICEVLHRRKDVAHAALLLRYAIAAHMTGPCQRIEFYAHDNGYYEAACRRAGFDIQEYSQIMFGVRCLTDDPAITGPIMRSTTWSIAYGDTDSI